MNTSINKNTYSKLVPLNQEGFASLHHRITLKGEILKGEVEGELSRGRRMNKTMVRNYMLHLNLMLLPFQRGVRESRWRGSNK